MKTELDILLGSGPRDKSASQDVSDIYRALHLILAYLKVLHTGNGSPETVITAPVGHIYLRQDGGAGTTLYVKESGTGNTGWVGK